MLRHFDQGQDHVINPEDPEKPENYETRFNRIVNSGFVCLGLALGQRLGLMDALLEAENPLSSVELAEQMDFNERYVREWLHSMTAAKIIFVNEELKFYIPPECKAKTKNSLLYSTMLPAVAHLIKEVEQCFRSKDAKSAGYDFSKCGDVFQFMMEDRKSCNDKWIEEHAFPAQFVNRIRIKKVLEVGCGIGRITINVAKYLPEAEIIGIDIDEAAIETAKKMKEEENVPNVNFFRMDSSKLPEDWTSQFDWIAMFTVLHDLPDPDSCLKEVIRVANNDCIMTFIDPLCHSDPRRNIGNDVFAASLTMSCFICLPCSHSAPPYVGHGLGWGFENRAKYLKNFGLKVLSSESQNTIHCKKQN